MNDPVVKLRESNSEVAVEFVRRDLVDALAAPMRIALAQAIWDTSHEGERAEEAAAAALAAYDKAVGGG